jgi:AcrR family transcriptional regulator
MSGARLRRRQAIVDEIVAAAWALVHEHGLAYLSMRDLGERAEMHASSLYQYFPSKLHIYDALFALGHRQLHDSMADLDVSGEPEVVFRAGSARFTAFCVADPVRYQLLFQRVIPGFVPTAASMTLAEQSYAGMAAVLTRLGVVEPADMDLWAALQMGLTEQQLANDPDGDRWVNQLDRAIDMFLAHIRDSGPKRSKQRPRQKGKA